MYYHWLPDTAGCNSLAVTFFRFTMALADSYTTIWGRAVHTNWLPWYVRKHTAGNYHSHVHHETKTHTLYIIIVPLANLNVNI